MDINKDPDSGRTMEPDMVLISNLGSDVTMAPCGSISHPDWHEPSVAWLSDTSMVLGNAQTLDIGMAFDGIRSHR